MQSSISEISGRPHILQHGFLFIVKAFLQILQRPNHASSAFRSGELQRGQQAGKRVSRISEGI
jgi:hypothetical protein